MPDHVQLKVHTLMALGREHVAVRNIEQSFVHVHCEPRSSQLFSEGNACTEVHMLLASRQPFCV